jgi:hypothetical protein
MTEIQEKILREIIGEINRQISEGRTVRIRGKDVEEIDIALIKKGYTEYKRVYIKFKDKTINILPVSEFLSKKYQVM